MAKPPVPVQTSTGSTDAGGAWTATGAAGTAGNIVILQVLQDGGTGGSVSISSSTNIEDLAGTDNQWTSIGAFASGSLLIQHLWIGRLINTSAPVVTGANSGTDDLYWRMYEFANVNTGTTLASVLEQNGGTTPATSTGSTASVTDADVITTGASRLCLNFIAVNDDNALAQFTSSTGGVWSPEPEYADSVGTDGCISFQSGFVSVACQTNFYVSNVLYGGSGTSEELSTAFQTNGAITTAAVYLGLTKNGSPTDNLVVEIQTNSGNQPTGTVLGSGTLAASTLTTAKEWIRVPVSASLSAGTKYHIVIRRDGARDTSNYALWYEGFGDNYASMGRNTKNSGAWGTESSTDCAFAVVTSTDEAGGTLGSGSFTMAAADQWGVVGFALLPVPDAAAATSLPLRNRNLSPLLRM